MNYNNWMNDRKMLRQTSAKRTSAPTQARQLKKLNRWSKVQAGRSDPNPSSKAAATTPKVSHLNNDWIFNLWISPEFRFIHFVYKLRVWNDLIQICKTASKFHEKYILKIGRCVAKFTFNSLEYICRMQLFHVVVLWPLVNNGKEMNTEL